MIKECLFVPDSQSSTILAFFMGTEPKNWNSAICLVGPYKGKWIVAISENSSPKIPFDQPSNGFRLIRHDYLGGWWVVIDDGRRFVACENIPNGIRAARFACHLKEVMYEATRLNAGKTKTTSYSWRNSGKVAGIIDLDDFHTIGGTMANRRLPRWAAVQRGDVEGAVYYRTVNLPTCAKIETVNLSSRDHLHNIRIADAYAVWMRETDTAAMWTCCNTQQITTAHFCSNCGKPRPIRSSIEVDGKVISLDEARVAWRHVLASKPASIVTSVVCEGSHPCDLIGYDVSSSSRK